MNSILDRLREPSTWAGFAGLFSTAAAFLPTWAPVLSGLAGVASAAAVKLREGGK